VVADENLRVDLRRSYYSARHRLPCCHGHSCARAKSSRPTQERPSRVIYIHAGSHLPYYIEGEGAASQGA
jgi:hypothetical protein